jgi:hypothetical protein
MRYKYREYRHKDDPNKKYYKPVIPIKLGYQGKYQAVWALIDSGAELCLIHSSVGKLLGIDVPTGRQEMISGISGHLIPAYMHKVHLIISPLAGVDIEMGFTDSNGIKDGALLGQHGFFDEFDVRFQQWLNAIHIQRRS